MADEILRLVRRQKAELANIDARALEGVARAYAAMYDRLTGDVNALRLAIESLESPSVAQIKALPEYRALLRRSRLELGRFNVYLETVAESAAGVGIERGLADSLDLMRAIAGGRWAGLRPNVIAPLLDYLRRDGPLYARLALITDGTVEKVTESIIKGVGLGRSPRVIASAIQDAFGGGLTDALRNVRTVQLWSYRDSARANYMASGGIVSGWVWFAELDSETCMSCVAQHGTIHDLDETLDDHYNGRCAAIPYIEAFGNPVEQSGQDWFAGLSAEQQQAMMGKEKHAAWQDGRFELGQLSRQVSNDVYGTMRTEASLASLIGEGE